MRAYRVEGRGFAPVHVVFACILLVATFSGCAREVTDATPKPSVSAIPDCHGKGTPVPSVLHRKHFTCDGVQRDQELGYGDEEIIDLQAVPYENYTCKSRLQEQCVNDGSWDTYYLESCDYVCSGAT